MNAGASIAEPHTAELDDQEESEQRGDSCPLRPAIAVVRAGLDNVLVGRPERA
jgi:hypothetical protein